MSKPAKIVGELKINLPARTPGAENTLRYILCEINQSLTNQYRSLPWPSQIKKIVVYTAVMGGLGDIAAAAKVIELMQQFSTELTFDWVIAASIKPYTSFKPHPLSFLKNIDNVSIRNDYSEPISKEPADFLISDPHRSGESSSFIGRKIAGPLYYFREIADLLIYPSIEFKNYGKYDDVLHTRFFPGKVEFDERKQVNMAIPMGLRAGTGVLIDKERINALLSSLYSSPAYIHKIKDDPKLKSDILYAMDIEDEKSNPDYDKYSLNFGYAHCAESWGKFIDCVSYEQKKNVVIVLNYRGEYADFSIEEFKKSIFTSERLSFLQENGYNTISFRHQDDKEPCFLTKTKPGDKERRLTVIVREVFSPHDIKQLQLASERHLATGDNSVVESWCARSKFFVYEDVHNGGFKYLFLNQQIKIAKQFSPKLSRILALFGQDSLGRSFTKVELAEIKGLLETDEVAESTLKFCHSITKNYAFQEILEGSLKRAAWHHFINFSDLEAKALGKKFQTELLDYLSDSKSAKKTLQVAFSDELHEHITKRIGTFIKQSEASSLSASKDTLFGKNVTKSAAESSSASLLQSAAP